MQIKTKDKFMEVTEKVGLDRLSREKYAKFMIQRFSNDYTVESYAVEWALRFQSGHPETYMDAISKGVE